MLALLCEGLTNAEIATRLVLSVKTVNHHISAVLDKLGVDNRHDAVRVHSSDGVSPGVALR